jgi:hypothetical protein
MEVSNHTLSGNTFLNQTLKNMCRSALLFVLLTTLIFSAKSQNMQRLDSLMLVRGVCISAPQTADVDRFVKFMNEELAPSHINLLILRVDYNFEYTSYPNLRDENPLSKSDVKKIVEAGKKNGIRLIPQVNLLGHQSWHSTLENLLKGYPEFDETPHVKLPEKYEWPNADSLYCKSYCPLHPEVHQVIFAIIDEIVEVFEADAFQAGMDEVFYIGDDQCPRCAGKDKAELFAGEVQKIRDHLAAGNKSLWIWGDRLLDGATTGLGMWEASMNGTYPAIDLIPKDVVICDWHYNRPEPTDAYFALKGFNALTCSWNKPEVARQQIQQTIDHRANTNKKVADRIQGMVQTVWSPAESFLDNYYADETEDGSVICAKTFLEEMKKLAGQ